MKLKIASQLLVFSPFANPSLALLFSPPPQDSFLDHHSPPDSQTAVFASASMGGFETPLGKHSMLHCVGDTVQQHPSIRERRDPKYPSGVAGDPGHRGRFLYKQI